MKSGHSDIRRLVHARTPFENKEIHREEVKSMKKFVAICAILGMFAGTVAFAEVATAPTATAKTVKATKKAKAKKATPKTAATVTAPTGTK
jgi:hypothetical protein